MSKAHTDTDDTQTLMAKNWKIRLAAYTTSVYTWHKVTYSSYPR
jgi:hypothetical protein